MIERKSHIFIVEYFAKGTAIILCAAYHLGMHFDNGYVWFLNPWLAHNWWKFEDVLPPECSFDELRNITTWSFTVGHQLITVPMLQTVVPLKPQTQNDSQSNSNDKILFLDGKIRLHRRLAVKNNDEQPKHLENTKSNDSSRRDRVVNLTRFDSVAYDLNNYAIHTYESVIVLASALVYLLRQNPSAMSVFDSPQIAKIYQELVATSDFDYAILGKDLSLSDSDQYVALEDIKNSMTDEQLDRTRTSTSFESIPEDSRQTRIIQLASQLRFNSLNERFADYWVLRQHQANKTVPILMWFFDPELFPDDLGAGLLSTWERVDLSSIAISEQFAQLIGERWLGDVNWSSNGGPPGDGSETEEKCVFYFIARAFGTNCLYASVLVAIFFVLLVAIPALILFVVYHRRKLQETERRIRQPYEQLCAELKDIDVNFILVLNSI